MTETSDRDLIVECVRGVLTARLAEVIDSTACYDCKEGWNGEIRVAGYKIYLTFDVTPPTKLEKLADD